MKKKQKHRHKWRCVGSCEVAWAILYVRYRCKCGARKLRYHHYGFEKGWIKLKRSDTWAEHELP